MNFFSKVLEYHFLAFSFEYTYGVHAIRKQSFVRSGYSNL